MKKRIVQFMFFAFAFYALLQCKTDHKAETAPKETTKTTAPVVDNSQDAAKAIVAASATFSAADCQGNTDCQSVQAQAAVLANQDPSQLATVLTPDNIQQAVTQVQSLSDSSNLVSTSTTSDTTNTEIGTNTGADTAVMHANSPLPVSLEKKNAGIALISIGGGLFLLGIFAAKNGYKKKEIKQEDLIQKPEAPAPSYVSVEELAQKFNLNEDHLKV